MRVCNAHWLAACHVRAVHSVHIGDGVQMCMDL